MREPRDRRSRNANGEAVSEAGRKRGERAKRVCERSEQTVGYLIGFLASDASQGSSELASDGVGIS
jgi:hypothetical protein